MPKTKTESGCNTFGRRSGALKKTSPRRLLIHQPKQCKSMQKKALYAWCSWLRNRRFTKTLLVMKLTFILLTAAALHVAAKGTSQTITFSGTNVPLEKVFSVIKQQTGYVVFFDYNSLEGAKPVRLNVKDAPLTEFLDQALRGQAFGYSIRKKTIFITRTSIARSPSDHPQDPPGTDEPAPPIDISGKVTDHEGNPLAGANVKIKGADQVAVTGADGFFSLKDADENAVLEISYVGFETTVISLQGRKSLVIHLKPKNNSLDEIQVIGYGTTTRRANTGNVTTVNAKTIAQYPTTNVLDVLQGVVPGLTIYRNSGNLNSTYKVQIRGINGLSGGSPLYIIDGIAYQSGSWETRNLTLGSNTPNGPSFQGYDGMGTINPNDIESISILKDADATAIYGSRGSDGVILITTKKGQAGKPKIDASVYMGINDVAHFQPMLNLQQYLKMRREAHANDNSPVGVTEYDLNGSWDTTRSTDWQRTLAGHSSRVINAQAGISGGSPQLQYRISAGYNYANDLASLGGSDQKASLHVNLNSTTENKKFSVSFSGGYLYHLNTLVQSDLTSSINLPVNAPALYTSAGELNYQNSTFMNPLLIKNAINKTPEDNLTSSLTLSYRPVRDLEFKLQTGYNKQTYNEFLGSPTTVYPPYLLAQVPSLTGSSTFIFGTNSSWSIEPQVNYGRKIGKGKLAATIGASLQRQNQTLFGLSVTGYSSDLLLSSISAGTSITSAPAYRVSPRKNASVFGRINYNWKDKYYLDLTGRNDGSSNFGENKQYHLFSAAGAGWIFSEENLIKNNLSFLSYGKLRASYGSTGRNAIAPYSFLSTYSTTTVGAYNGIAGLIPTGLPNPDLSWETTKKAELGLELRFFEGRVGFETNFYRNRTSGTLTSSALSRVTGFASITENLPAVVQNQGFDFSLTTTNIRNKNFSWSSTLQFTRDRNKLIKYPDLQNSVYANKYIIGKPINIVKLYRSAGVNTQTGIYQFYAANGSIVTTPAAADQTGIADLNPDFYGSLQNNFTCKQFSLSFLFRFIRQDGRNAFYAGTINSTAPGYSVANFNTWVVNRWQKPGDVTNVQRFGTAAGIYTAQTYATQSTLGIGDASYARLQNISLSYQLPESALRRLRLTNAQAFVQGDNLLTITGYDGWDPENQSVRTLPPLRTITVGFKLTL